MNIKILDSWIRDYLKTKAAPSEFAKAMSLTSVSIERMEKHGNDFLYDIEVTTNRPDVASVIGLAREAGAVLPQFGIPATFVPLKLEMPKETIEDPLPLTIKSDDRLVNRLCAVVLEITIKDSPEEIKERLETSDIRSINNIVDITNYVMRTVGHPTHVFDYDLLKTRTLVVRESRKNERIKTLDGKEYILEGGDIVAEDGVGNIVDLLGVMGLENSVVKETTKRIIYFINNIDPQKIRETSMRHGIRTEAAQLNEKSIDPETAYEALLYGIELFKKIADGKIVSEIIDIYPKALQPKKVSVSLQHIQRVMGVILPEKTALQILDALGFEPKVKGNSIETTVPTYRTQDIEIPEDIIEEIARVYGYHNIPNTLPPIAVSELPTIHNHFYWESRVKNALKYWGFTEAYTYPIVSEEMYEGPTEKAVTLANPLGEEFVYMRSTLVPSLLKVIAENKNYETVKLFEIANTYENNGKELPKETPMFAGVVKGKTTSFYEVKGVIEQVLLDLGIEKLFFKPSKQGGLGASVYIEKEYIGEIEVFDSELINFELNFEITLKHATNKKVFKPLAKHPPIIEDISLVVKEDILTGDIIETIEKQSEIIKQVTLLDKYENTRTFHIMYQDAQKNLTQEEVEKIRDRILKVVAEKFDAHTKE